MRELLIRGAKCLTESIGVKALLDQQSSQIQALRTNSQSNSSDADSPEARQPQMTQVQQIRDETNTKISALLDDTQANLRGVAGETEGGHRRPPVSRRKSLAFGQSRCRLRRTSSKFKLTYARAGEYENEHPPRIHWPTGARRLRSHRPSVPTGTIGNSTKLALSGE